MNDQDGPAYRGHIDECLRHFSIWFYNRVEKGSPQSSEAKKPLARFCEVTVDTVSRWFSEPDVLPVGLQYLKLMCFFDTIGYRVIEMEKLTQPRRGTLELIGYGVISADEVAKILNYSSKDPLYQVLKGNTGTSDEREIKMRDIFISRKEDLDKAKDKIKDSFAVYMVSTSWVKEPTQSKSKFLGAVSEVNTRYRIAIALMQALLLILEEEPIESFSVKEAERVNKDATKLILRLSARLIAISSGLMIEERGKGENAGQ